MSRVGEAIRQENEAKLEELERMELDEFNMFERQAMLDAIHYASLRQVNAERFKNGDK
jgi:hypothetical protein